jgi:RsiW-degrading membrane proteinase PrsW (M82 family)
VTLPPELVVITAAAVVPPLLAAVLVRRVCRPTERSRVAMTMAFSWGVAVAATIAAPLNDAASRLVVAAAGADASGWVMPALGGPVIEELVKAIGFVAVALIAPRMLADVAGGVVIGALVGLGFAATENVGYYTIAAVQGGAGGLVRAVFLRGLVEGANHAAFTASTGAGVGWAASRAHALPARLAAGGLGLVAAVGLHGVWNGLVSGRIATLLCHAPAPDAACAPAPATIDLLVTVPVLEAAFLLPAVLALAALVRRTR